MKEGEIYYILKTYLMNKGWRILAGEPPDGSDDVPRIEIRDPHQSGIGSKGSFKIDLISVNDGTLLLTELKPKYDINDIRKLNEICTTRLQDLFNALEERCGITKSDINCIIKCIGVSSVESHSIPNDFVALVVKQEREVVVIVGDSVHNPLIS